MPHIFAVIYDYFIFVCFKKVATPLLDRNKTVIEILLKGMAISYIKSLVLQLKLITLVMVYTVICARENFLVYCNKTTDVGMQNDDGVKQYIIC